MCRAAAIVCYGIDSAHVFAPAADVCTKQLHGVGSVGGLLTLPRDPYNKAQNQRPIDIALTAWYAQKSQTDVAVPCMCLPHVLQVPTFFVMAPGMHPVLADSARAASAFVFIAVNKGASLALGC